MCGCLLFFYPMVFSRCIPMWRFLWRKFYSVVNFPCLWYSLWKSSVGIYLQFSTYIFITAISLCQTLNCLHLSSCRKYSSLNRRHIQIVSWICVSNLPRWVKEWIFIFDDDSITYLFTLIFQPSLFVPICICIQKFIELK